MNLRNLLPFAFILLFHMAQSQWGPAYTPIRVIVSADKSDWNYQVGESVVFSVSVFENGNPIDGEVKFEVGPEKMEAMAEGQLTLKKGSVQLKPYSMKTPGYLRCKISYSFNGKTYMGTATAAFSPEAIEPTTIFPDDFNEFWAKTLEENAAIPLNSKMTRVEELSDESLDVYHIKFQNFRYGSYIYGVLSVPKGEGKFPALLKVPGAGVWPHFMAQDADAKKGMITLDIRIHGIPMIMPEYNEIYGELWNGALNEYWTYNLDQKDKYYYRRVYAGCVKAIDFIYSLPKFDGENVGVTGGSQGGALSIVTAALDKRIDYLVSYYPALCDLTGYLNGRAGGWPHLFNEDNVVYNGSKEKISTSRYFDVVNFARLITVPGYYSWGYNDKVCPPTSIQSAYNVITAPKTKAIMLDAGHYAYPEQQIISDEWMYSRLSATD